MLTRKSRCRNWKIGIKTDFSGTLANPSGIVKYVPAML